MTGFSDKLRVFDTVTSDQLCQAAGIEMHQCAFNGTTTKFTPVVLNTSTYDLSSLTQVIRMR